MSDKDDILQTLSQVVPKNPRCVFELGAAGGEDTKQIMQSIGFVDGYYYAVEPEPNNILPLNHVISHIPNAFALPFAIGNENKGTQFYRSSHSDPNIRHTHSGSLKIAVEHIKLYPWCKFDTTIVVQMVRLDDLCKILGISHVNLIWSDIQGADNLMIDGAQEILKHTDYLLAECFEERLYEGQMNATEMHNALPGEWRIVKRWEHDILFERLQ